MGKNPDQRSGINIPDPQHWNKGIKISHGETDYFPMKKRDYIFDGVAAADEDAGKDLVTVALHAQALRLVHHPVGSIHRINNR